jgi:parallel beta-helix repeat protein
MSNNKNYLGIILVSIIVITGFSNIAYAQIPTISYDPVTRLIAIENGIAYPQDIAVAVSNPSVFDRSGNTYIITANLFIDSGAGLIIKDVTWKFNCSSNGEYGIDSEGILNIDNSTITVTNTNYRSKGMYCDKISHHLSIIDSEISYLGVPGNNFGITSIYPSDDSHYSNISNNTIHHSHGGLWLEHHSQGTTVKNNIIYDVSDQGITCKGKGKSIIIDNNEIYNISGSDCIGILSWSRNAIISNNTVHDLLETISSGIVPKQTINVTIFNNTIYNIPSRGLYATYYDFESSVLGNTVTNNTVYNCGYGITTKSYNLISVISNNTVYDCGTGLDIQRAYNHTFSNNNWHNNNINILFASGAPTDIKFINERIENATSYGIRSQSSGSYDNTIFQDCIFDGNLYDVRFETLSTLELIFINTEYSTVSFTENDNTILSYFYCDVFVQNAYLQGVNGAVFSFENELDSNYPSLNVYGENKSSFIAVANGHTPLPTNPVNSAVILDYWQTNTEKTEMTYTITAEKDVYSTTVTGVNPDETWYRSDPNIPSHTVTITLLTRTDANPTASAGLDRTAYPCEPITFDGSTSSDDQGIVSYIWDFDASDGLQQDAADAVVTHSYDTAGTYTATLTVTDTDGNEGCDAVTIKVVPPDTTPPAVGNVIASNPNEVKVVYSEAVEETSATAISNYAIDNGITISSASLGSDLKTVTLATSTHTEGITYTLTVNNVKDRVSVPNTIAPNTQVTYQYVKELIITDITAASGKNYVLNTLDTGKLQYIDRSYTFSSVPSSYINLKYIRTANDDKGSTANPYLEFDVNQDVTVYVVHDDRISPKPSWLASFTDTGDDLVGEGGTFSLYANNFSAGHISLGGNDGDSYSMYNVVLKPLTNSTFVNNPPELEAIGDKIVDEGQTLTFALSATDADGDVLTFSASNLPDGALFDSANRTFQWTPNLTQSGTYSNVHFEVTDGFLTDTEDVTIMVNDILAPIITSVNAASITSTSATIKWNTDEPSDSLVKYGTVSGVYTADVYNAADVVSHSIQLTGLSPDTTYYYVVNSTDPCGNSNESVEYNFTTGSQDTAPTSVTDPIAAPSTIPEDTDNDPQWGESSRLNVIVTDDDGIASVTIDLSAIGRLSAQPMNNIGGNIWSVNTSAAAGTPPQTYDLRVNATDIYGHSNTSVVISLTVVKNGDVNNDGEVDYMGDAVYLLRHTRNMPGYEAVLDGIADVTGDGKVDFVNDAVYLVRHTTNTPGYEILH